MFLVYHLTLVFSVLLIKKIIFRESYFPEETKTTTNTLTSLQRGRKYEKASLLPHVIDLVVLQNLQTNSVEFLVKTLNATFICLVVLGTSSKFQKSTKN